MKHQTRRIIAMALVALLAFFALPFGNMASFTGLVANAAGETIGYTTDGTLSDGVAANYYNAIRYQASSNMTVDQMKIKISVAGTGNMKCAIYSDNSGSMGTFLRGTEEKSNLGVGWQTFNLTSPLQLTSGSYYWLVSWRSGSYEIASDSATGVNYWGSFTYAASWPTSLPSSGGASNFRHSFYAVASGTSSVIGYTTDGTLSDGVAANYYNALRYQAGSTMTVNQMKIKISTAGTGKMKCAIYSDNGGSIGSFLRGTEEKSNLGLGWQTFNLTSSLQLTSGTYYWLVSWRDGTYAIASESATGVNYWGSHTYAASWPTNLPASGGASNFRHSFYALASGATPTPTPTPTPPPSGTPVTIDRAAKYQTIEGFGFFGGMDSWWSSSDPSHFYTDAWLTKVIDDLGISIWRNEIYPNNPVTSSTSVSPQDANWNKQKPLVQALKAKADAYRVPLKFIATIWSPPGEWKINCSFSWAGDTAATRGGAHNSTKDGGTLDPSRYSNYASWLNSGIQMYKDAGVDLYALSLQNEPGFVEPYNSCVYTTSWYNDLLKNVVPTIKSTHPNVKIFGAENMLSLEGALENYQWFYNMAIKNDANALSKIDRWAVHGYSDGVQAEAISNHRDYWTRTRQQFSDPTGKPYWMTETSGYVDSWEASGGTPGALDLGIAIHAALYHGRASAWVWWSGSGLDGLTQYNLMNGTNVGKRYYVSKHFYRFIRPGSRMVNLSVNDSSLLACAFENTTLNNFVSVIINTSTSSKTINLQGSNIPDTFSMYRSSSVSGENCSLIGSVSKNSITIPAKSIITLVNGAYKE